MSKEKTSVSRLLSRAASAFTVALPPRAIPLGDDFAEQEYEEGRPSLLCPPNPAFGYREGEGPLGGILKNKRRVTNSSNSTTSPSAKSKSLGRRTTSSTSENASTSGTQKSIRRSSFLTPTTPQAFDGNSRGNDKEGSITTETTSAGVLDDHNNFKEPPQSPNKRPSLTVIVSATSSPTSVSSDVDSSPITRTPYPHFAEPPSPMSSLAPSHDSPSVSPTNTFVAPPLPSSPLAHTHTFSPSPSHDRSSPPASLQSCSQLSPAVTTRSDIRSTPRSSIHFAPLPPGKPKKGRSSSITLGVAARASLITGLGPPVSPLQNANGQLSENGNGSGGGGNRRASIVVASLGKGKGTQEQKESEVEERFSMTARELARENGRTMREEKEMRERRMGTEIMESADKENSMGDYGRRKWLQSVQEERLARQGSAALTGSAIVEEDENEKDVEDDGKERPSPGLHLTFGAHQLGEDGNGANTVDKVEAASITREGVTGERRLNSLKNSNNKERKDESYVDVEDLKKVVGSALPSTTNGKKTIPEIKDRERNRHVWRQGEALDLEEVDVDVPPTPSEPKDANDELLYKAENEDSDQTESNTSKMVKAARTEVYHRHRKMRISNDE